jgi:hypothetical protein
MSRSKTLAQLEEQVRWLADQERAVLRHTQAAVRREINQSIQRYRELVSDEGHTYYLKYWEGTIPSGATETELGTKLGWGLLEIDAVDPPVTRIFGVDILYDGTIWELDPVEFRERNLYQFGARESWAIPTAFFVYDENKIGLLPAPQREYKYQLWYLPEADELADDADEFNPGVPGGDQWVVLDVMQKLAMRDNNKQLAIATQREKIQVQSEILKRMTQRQRAGAPKRLDTRNRSRTKGWPWPWRRGGG